MAVRTTDVPEFADLFAIGKLPSRCWTKQELGRVLEHQLDAPLVADLPAAWEHLPADRPQSFAELFSSAAPDVDLLRLVKEFAKQQLSSEEPLVPAEVAHVLYYTAIGVARNRCGQRLSRLSPQQLQRGLSWCLDRDWLDPRLNEVLVF